MKSYNHIWEQMLTKENITKAVRKASLGKRERPAVKRILNNLDKEIPKLRHYAEQYTHRDKKPKYVKEGSKVREIIVPSFREQVLHHMIVEVLQPVIMHGMYAHCHGSIPGRGPAAAKRQIRRWIRDTRSVKYFLKMDIRHFFASIQHDRLKAFVSKCIHDTRFLHLLFEIIDTTDCGLPLGFHTSHWLANWYLQPLDYYIKQELKATYYVRYMDDMVIFDSNKRNLHEMRRSIADYLDSIGLELKGNWQVCRFHKTDKYGDHYRFLDFMGFRFYRNRTTLRKGIMLRMCRRARHFHKNPGIYSCRKMLSALGWLKQTDTYDMYLARIKPYINFQSIKRKVSRYDKRIGKEQQCGIGLKAG